MEYIYIKKGIGSSFIKLTEELDSNQYQIGTTYNDFVNGKYVELNDSQKEYLSTYPNSSAYNVFNLIKEDSTEKALADAKSAKISEIEIYDASETLNSFTVNGISSWFDMNMRTSFKGSISAARLLNETSISFYVSTTMITLSLDNAEKMLAQIQRYADSCYNQTITNKLTVNFMTDISSITAFDVTTGYPSKLIFTI